MFKVIIQGIDQGIESEVYDVKINKFDQYKGGRPDNTWFLVSIGSSFEWVPMESCKKYEVR